MLSLAHVDKYYQLFLSLGLGVGLVSGFICIPCLAIQSHHWHSRRALAIGIVFTGTGFISTNYMLPLMVNLGSSVGGTIFPIMLNSLLSRGVDFSWTVRASGFVVLVMLAIANFLMRSRSHVINRTHQNSRLKELFGDNGKHKNDFVKIVEHTITQSKDHLLGMLKDVEKLGGEGLMIRKPGSCVL